MRTPKIIEGRSFDWEDARKHAETAVDSAGNVNWMAASFADPGVTKCPACGEFYWKEGVLVECLGCGRQWETGNRRTHPSDKAKEDGG